MPLATEAERVLIGSILKGELQPAALESALAVEDFGLESHKRIVTAVYELHRRGEGISGPTLYREIERGYGGVSLTEIISLTDDIPLIVDIEGFIRSVKNRSIQRKLILACQHTMNLALLGEDTPEAIGRAQKVLSELSAATEPEVEFLTPIQVIQEAGGLEKYAKRRSTPGILSGWDGLDRLTHGFHPGELVIIAGSTSRGKTALALNISHNAARKGTGVAVYSMEMQRQELTDRLICIAGKVSSQSIRKPVNGDASKVIEATGALQGLPVYLCDRSTLTLPSIEGSLRRIISKHPEIGMAVVDYLGLVTPTGRETNRAQEIGKISRGLKVLAGELGIPIIAVCQLNRRPGAEDRRPELSDLRDSGEIEQDASVVIFIHSNKKYIHGDGPDWFETELILAKQRNGRANVVVDFIFNPSWGVFSEPERTEEYEKTYQNHTYADHGGHRKRGKKDGKKAGEGVVPDNPEPLDGVLAHADSPASGGREVKGGIINEEMWQ